MVPPDDVLAILVVDADDTCRAPFVAALLEHELDVAGVRTMVSSAGLRAVLDEREDHRVARLLADRGLRTVRRTPRRLTAPVLATLGRDLVITMSDERLIDVFDFEPGALPRTFPLDVLATLDPVPSWWQALDAHHDHRDFDPLRPNVSTDDLPDPAGKQGDEFVWAIQQLTVITMTAARFIATDESEATWPAPHDWPPPQH